MIPLVARAEAALPPGNRERQSGGMAAPITWIPADNTTADVIPSHGLVKVVGVTDGILQLDTPDLDSDTSVAVVSDILIPEDGSGEVTFDSAVIVAYDMADGTPLAGEEWGAASGSYLLRSGKTGFIILGGAGYGLVNAIRAVASVASGAGSLEVEDVDEAPSYTGITQLRFDQADGFVLSNPSAGIARVDLAIQMSVAVDSSGLKLSGDVSSPGNYYLYGTNGSGVKGWYTQGYHVIQEEASNLTERRILNFVGSSATAADDAGNARTNVTFAANLNAIASLSSAADTFAYFTGSGTAALATVTPFILTLLDDTTAAQARQTLGLGTVATWTKVTKTYTQLAAAATSNDIEIYSLAAKEVIHGVVIKHTTQFSGGTLVTYSVSVGVSGSSTKYASALTVSAAVADTTFVANGGTATAANPQPEDFGSSKSIRAFATSFGDNLNAATQGSVDFYLYTSNLP